MTFIYLFIYLFQAPTPTPAAQTLSTDTREIMVTIGDVPYPISPTADAFEEIVLPESVEQDLAREPEGEPGSICEYHLVFISRALCSLSGNIFRYEISPQTTYGGQESETSGNISLGSMSSAHRSHIVRKHARRPHGTAAPHKAYWLPC